jgi:predicted RNA-binding protein YlqC (UPF0109 family)
MSELADLARVLGEALACHPESVRVREEQHGGETVVEVFVDDEDRGRINGRRGVTAAALRTVLSAAAARRGVRCRLEIVE